MIFRTKTKQPVMILYNWIKERGRWTRKFRVQERRSLPDELWHKIFDFSKSIKGPPVDSWGLIDGELNLTPSFEHLMVNLFAKMNVSREQFNFVKSYKLNRVLRYILDNIRPYTRYKMLEHYNKCNCCYRHTVNRPQFTFTTGRPVYHEHTAKSTPAYQACLKPVAFEYSTYSWPPSKKGICECTCRKVCRTISTLPEDEHVVDIYDDYDDMLECSHYRMSVKYSSAYEAAFKWINSVSVHKLYVTSVDITSPGHEGTYKISLYDLAKSGNMRLVRQVLGAPEFEREKLENFVLLTTSLDQYYYIVD